MAFLYAPRESLAYFTSVLWQTDRVGAADFTPNQSLAGVLARLYDQTHAPTMLWVSFAAVCAALGLSRAVTAHREGDELAAFTAGGYAASGSPDRADAMVWALSELMLGGGGVPMLRSV